MISLAFYRLLILTFLLINFPFINSQLHTENISVSSRVLDSFLQEYAFRAFYRLWPMTGVIYDANVAPRYTGISVSALRLRSGGLRRKGYYGYKEFDIPIGVIENPYVARVILVYQNLGNWSSFYYPLPGYLFLSPVVGLLAYNASHFPAKKLPELDIRSSENPILIKFKSLIVPPNGVSPKCVFFDLFGGVEFDHVLNGSVCASVNQGHFGVVVEENFPVPEKSPENPIAIDGGGGGGGGGSIEWWIGGVVGGGIWVVGVVGMWWAMRRCRWRRSVKKMECAAENGVPLAAATVGNFTMPVAMEIRTKPVLENKYVF